MSKRFKLKVYSRHFSALSKIHSTPPQVIFQSRKELLKDHTLAPQGVLSRPRALPPSRSLLKSQSLSPYPQIYSECAF